MLLFMVLQLSQAASFHNILTAFLSHLNLQRSPGVPQVSLSVYGPYWGFTTACVTMLLYTYHLGKHSSSTKHF